MINSNKKMASVKKETVEDFMFDLGFLEGKISSEFMASETKMALKREFWEKWRFPLFFGSWEFSKSIVFFLQKKMDNEKFDKEFQELMENMESQFRAPDVKEHDQYHFWFEWGVLLIFGK